MKKLFLIQLFIFFNISQIINAQEGNYRDSVDVVQYKIYLDFTDLNSSQLKGNTILKITSKQEELKSIALDLHGLVTDKVLVNNVETKFSYNNSVIRIFPKKTITKKDTLEINIFYHGFPKKDKSWGGFFIQPSYAFNYGVGMAAQPPNYGRVWYPCIDNFTDRALYEYYITVKNEHAAVCPGTLISIKKAENNKTKTFHWKLHNSIPTYLSSIAVSDYAAIKDTVKGLERTIPIEIYVNKADFEAGKKTFSHVKDYFHAFEKAFGPYVWERIGYVSTPFKGGAMEHATNIAYSANCNGTMNCDYTLAHELSHHWFGDLVTCKTEKDMWLNEGWAVFSEAIFEEFKYGKKAYKNYVRKNHKRVLQLAHIYDRGYRALYGLPHDYTYGFTVYKKGGDIVRTLRSHLGDDKFFNSLKKYFKEYAFKSISTHEFKEYLSKTSGESLDEFFDFWVYNQGFPHFSIDNYKLTNKRNKYFTDIKISQRLVGTEKHAANTKLEIGILDRSWKVNKYMVNIAGKTELLSLKLDYEPLLFMIDPDEKIADATTDEYIVLKRTGKFEFSDELFDLNVKHIADSTFFRITHNWIIPKISKNSPIDYEFAERYWDVQFINKDNFEAFAEFKFDLSYKLDNKLSNFTIDNIVLLYRKNNTDNWKEITENINKENNQFIIDYLKIGQYSIAAKKTNN